MEERPSFAVPGLDQLLDKLQVELAADDKPVITDMPVGSVPSELVGREDHGNIVAVAHEDLKGGSLRPPPKPKPRGSLRPIPESGGSSRPPPKPKLRGGLCPKPEPGGSPRPPPQPEPVAGQSTRLCWALLALAEKGLVPKDLL